MDFVLFKCVQMLSKINYPGQIGYELPLTPVAMFYTIIKNTRFRYIFVQPITSIIYSFSLFFIGYKKVAVKMLKASHRREEVADLLSEFKYMPKKMILFFILIF